MEREGRGGRSVQEAPGRHPQFRDCFSDDTLYTHGQQQPTHYGNDTCASIRINILMDTREEVGGWRISVSGTHRRVGDAAGRPRVRARDVAEPRAGRGTPERKQRDSAEEDRTPSSLVNNAN